MLANRHTMRSLERVAALLVILPFAACQKAPRDTTDAANAQPSRTAVAAQPTPAPAVPDAAPTADAESAPQASVASDAGAGAFPSAPPTYGLADGNESQELWLTARRKDAIEFVLHRSGSCDFTFAGRAKVDGEAEMVSDDDESSGYFAMKYQFEDAQGCSFAIRINAEDGSKARIEPIQCKTACAILEAPMRRPKK